MLSVTEYARRAQITPRAVRARIERGTLAAEKAGGLWWVREDAVRSLRRPGRRLSAASFDQLAACFDEDDRVLTPDERRRARERVHRIHAGGLRQVQTYARRSDMEVRAFVASMADLDELQTDERIVRTGVSHPSAEVYGPVLDGYVTREDAEDIELVHLLAPAVDGKQNVRLRIVPEVPDVRLLHVIADLLDDRHARSRSEAERLLGEVVR